MDSSRKKIAPVGLHLQADVYVCVYKESGRGCPTAHLQCIFHAGVSTNANLPSKSQELSKMAAIAPCFPPSEFSL